MDQITEQQKLPRKSKTVWRINNSLWSLLFWVVPGYFIFSKFYGADISWWLVGGLPVAALLLTALLIVITPEIKWRQWSYSIDEHEIELQHGIFIIRRTLIPIKRVQHVDTRQGPVLRQYNLADVVISTAATTHKIPALSEDTADRVRNEISTFARKAKEDV